MVCEREKAVLLVKRPGLVVGSEHFDGEGMVLILAPERGKCSSLVKMGFRIIRNFLPAGRRSKRRCRQPPPHGGNLMGARKDGAPTAFRWRW